MTRILTMITCPALVLLAVLSAPNVFAQPSAEDSDQLKIFAIEALMSAPHEKALPILIKVMQSENSDRIKARALFVLSQIDEPEAHEVLLDTARSSTGRLQGEAIRTIGIGGNPQVIARLADIYTAGDRRVKEQVLHAYLIAGDAEAVYQAAVDAPNEDIFELALNQLGAMGALPQLQRLREETGASRSLIHAYAVAGDVDSLLAIARDDSNPEQQVHAMHGLGIASGGDVARDAMVDIFRSSSDKSVRDAAMHGLMVGGHDDGLLELFRASTDQNEKAALLRQLVIMDSDEAMQAIDSALSERP
ncbi:MAG: HEAT repeat domain-containing protein [Pseudomonadota bacterium]